MIREGNAEEEEEDDDIIRVAARGERWILRCERRRKRVRSGFNGEIELSHQGGDECPPRSGSGKTGGDCA